MSSLFSTLDPAIQAHLVTLSPDEGALEGMAAGWLEKERAFVEESGGLGMESVDECLEPACGFLALTYSGSLVAVGPLSGKTRRAVYVSIDQRRGVPGRAESEQTVLADTAAVGRELVFSTGPVKRTSAIYKLAILPSVLTAAKQNQLLDEATLTLTKEFQAADDNRMDQKNA